MTLGPHRESGQVYGKWPGLNDHQLNEGRDLALTTDFRSVRKTDPSLRRSARSVQPARQAAEDGVLRVGMKI
jgi:uncharacterized protein (DUF1501 family)